MKFWIGALLLAAVASLVLAGRAWAAEQAWRDQAKSPDERAAALVGAMSLAEKFQLLRSSMPGLNPNRPADAIIAAGHVPGIARLGLPALRETDASLGVANLRNQREGDVATALPSGLALAATFDPQLAYEGGAMIGSEARAKRFNVMLAGGVNLVREPRNGRAFEYLSEDPLLSGVMAGEQVRGIQSNRIVSTVKHFALNDQETGRHVLDVKIGEAAARESDLLAFQIAIERGRPGSVMTAYNKVNGAYASQNRWLLTDVLKRDWRFAGWVMSDWGNVHSVDAINAGLDQQSGEEIDGFRGHGIPFGKPLMAALDEGRVAPARIDEAVRRYAHALFASGAFDQETLQPAPIDYEANARVAERQAEQAIVLLRNEGGVLPLADDVRSIALIGGHADIGVLSGGGSSQVRPVGGPALEVVPSKGGGAGFISKVYHPSSPLKALKARYPQADIRFADGSDPAAAAALARGAQVAIVMVEEWRTEARDVPSLALPDNQDALVNAVAAANPRTVVVLQTGGPVLLPWAPRVPAILQAWYPGQRGAEALVSVLSGRVNPSGRLPVTFPASEAQLPRPQLDGMAAILAHPELDADAQPLPAFTVDYDIDGSNVGHRWFALKGHAPAYPFGFGLSYTSFEQGGLSVTGGDTVVAKARVTNRGQRAGIATPQFYAWVAARGGPPVPRLIGWARVDLKPGESREVSITADPRLLAEFDTSLPGWRIKGGEVPVTLADHAPLKPDNGQRASAMLNARTLAP